MIVIDHSISLSFRVGGDMIVIDHSISLSFRGGGVI